jgi:hypothetical protein
LGVLLNATDALVPKRGRDGNPAMEAVSSSWHPKQPRQHHRCLTPLRAAVRRAHSDVA